MPRKFARLVTLRDNLSRTKNGYRAEQVGFQRRAVAAWTALPEKHDQEALKLMRAAGENNFRATMTS